jgi:hypothetical protein
MGARVLTGGIVLTLFSICQNHDIALGNSMSIFLVTGVENRADMAP